ncbi:hypothetical protein, partial [Paraburkholderia oxyphila]|uniref:hypothetical protein n=1 Tax=Paraburkholderia oxyphila TaxID=614212 RepID=UPI001C3F1C15
AKENHKKTIKSPGDFPSYPQSAISSCRLPHSANSPYLMASGACAIKQEKLACNLSPPFFS